MRTILAYIISPLRGLLASATGVGIGILLAKGIWLPPIIVVAVLAMLIGLLFVIGKANLAKHPEVGSLLMESGYALSLLAVAIAGGLLFWLIAVKSPGKNATALTRQAFSGLTGAFTVCLGALAINFNAWNPVKSAIQDKFQGRFNDRSDNDGKDAMHAVGYDNYGALHGGERVSGWGWQARRLRAKQIERALK
jgi:hypothetical protein